VLAHADLLVLPSLYEEPGTVLPEAMWLGLPMMASRTGGIPDVITDGVSGLLVPPGDSEALARAIDHVLSSPGLARWLGEAAWEQAKD
jgi:glycosyltransferase involved in cell wall biosynthesis